MIASLTAVINRYPDRSVLPRAGYMIVHPFTPGTFRTMYPSGRSYLFDMGAGHWDEGSLTWFITVWGRRGVVFDEIYGTLAFCSTPEHQ